MTTVDINRAGDRSNTLYDHTDSIVLRALLACGVLSSLLYAAMLIFVPLRWPGYSSAAQAVSELSAIDAPTRSLWVPFGALYTVLVSAFGVGVLLAAERERALRVAGSVLVIYGILGLFWPPMHLRGAQLTLTDTLHVVFAVATVLLMLIAILFGAAALGKAFRTYSIATLGVFVLFGTLTFLQAPRLAANLPTPWLGVWERVNIGAFLVWVVVFATILSRGGRRSDG